MILTPTLPTPTPLPKITFIIPSIGRKSLINSIASLINQTVPDEWLAIVMFDGIPPTMQMVDDPRVQFYQSNQKWGSAGAVRNEAIMQYVNTEWVAFLDDDDYLSPRYVETLLNEISQFSKADVVVFRMYKNYIEFPATEFEILPLLETTSLSVGRVGISYALKTELFHSVGVRFPHTVEEDFYCLLAVFRAGRVIMYSPFVRYFVGRKDTLMIADYPKFTNDEITGMRVFFGKC